MLLLTITFLLAAVGLPLSALDFSLYIRAPNKQVYLEISKSISDTQNISVECNEITFRNFSVASHLSIHNEHIIFRVKIGTVKADEVSCTVYLDESSFFIKSPVYIISPNSTLTMKNPFKKPKLSMLLLKNIKDENYD